MGKFSIHNSDYNKRGANSKILHLGVVVANTDEHDAGRIKVWIKGVDATGAEPESLPNAFPFLQKFLHIVPKVGETVWVMTPDLNNLHTLRLYMGPMISQPQFLNKDPHVISSTAALDGGFDKLKTAPSTIPENKGAYPSNDDVAIQGRNNADIIFKDSEILIRAGKFMINDKVGGIPKFNKDNPTYIQLKQDVQFDKKDVGVLNIVSDKINLLSHDGGNPRFKLNDQEDMISDDTIREIIAKAHPLVFGDYLIEYLELFKDALINHVHAYDGMKPEDLGGEVKIKKFLEYDVSKIISKNIRIN